MYIKDGIYKSIKAAVSTPITAGTVLTINGLEATAATAYGIVPETINVLPPTGRIYVAIGGTIDLTDPANKGITISKEMQKALVDIDFVPEPPAESGLPEITEGDVGKVLKATENGAEWAEEGSGTGVLYVEGSWEDDTFYINASYNDITAAVANGRNVIFVQNLDQDQYGSTKRAFFNLVDFGFPMEVADTAHYYADFGGSTYSPVFTFISESASGNLVQH